MQSLPEDVLEFGGTTTTDGGLEIDYHHKEGGRDPQMFSGQSHYNSSTKKPEQIPI